MIVSKIVGQGPPLLAGEHRGCGQRSAGETLVPQLTVNGRQPKETDADNAVGRAFVRARSWRTPPHWSSSDWHAEVRAILWSVAVSAGFTYDPRRGVPLRAHIYMRAISAAWTRYRQEWSYYLHCAVESGKEREPIAMPFDRAQADETIQHFLGQAFCHLSVEDRCLIRQLFWDRTREDRLAAMLKVSQQEVSRRKVRVLRVLRQTLNGYAGLLLSQLGSLCLTILDGLDIIDLIPDLDFFL